MHASFICPRKIELPSARPILLHNNSLHCFDNGFVNKLAIWSSVSICLTWRLPFCTKSHTKWRSIWICFIGECLTRLKLRWVAPRLSRNNYGDSEIRNVSSLKRVDSHIILDATAASARYSTFVMYMQLLFVSLSSKKWG